MEDTLGLWNSTCGRREHWALAATQQFRPQLNCSGRLLLLLLVLRYRKHRVNDVGRNPGVKFIAAIQRRWAAVLPLVASGRSSSCILLDQHVNTAFCLRIFASIRPSPISLPVHLFLAGEHDIRCVCSPTSGSSTVRLITRMSSSGLRRTPTISHRISPAIAEGWTDYCRRSVQLDSYGYARDPSETRPQPPLRCAGYDGLGARCRSRPVSPCDITDVPSQQLISSPAVTGIAPRSHTSIRRRNCRSIVRSANSSILPHPLPKGDRRRSWSSLKKTILKFLPVTQIIEAHTVNRR